MLQRSIQLSRNHSFFLFGPRGTGKSTLLRSWLKKEAFKDDEVVVFDLLDPETENTFSRRPQDLREQLLARGRRTKWVVLDEVQKVPALLDVVHGLIEEKKLKFALTGSSARKLKRGGANLLAGRAFEFHLHPFTTRELGAGFDLSAALRVGTLPGVIALKSDLDKKRFLRAYSNTYLREEIIAEQIVRNIDRFRNFLPVAAQANGTVLNYSKMSRQSGVDEKSISRFFEILSDTLMGYFIDPYHRSVRKRQLHKPKFYFFDAGVVRAMAEQLDQTIIPSTFLYGQAFEQFFVTELLRWIDYSEKEIRLSYLMTSSGVEVDLLVERSRGAPILLEIKSAEKLNEDHLRNLERVKEDFPDSRRIIAYRGAAARKMGTGIDVLPWRDCIAEITG